LPGGAEYIERRPVQRGHHTGRDSLGEPAVRGLRRDREGSGQLVPRAAGVQDVQDRRESDPVLDPSPPTTP
jgi:hypothetical protein